MTYIENSEQTISTNSEYAFTSQTPFEWTPSPYPTLTLSQRLELNKILHTGELTNNNVSTFSDQDIYEPTTPEPEPEEQKQNQGCCVIG